MRLSNPIILIIHSLRDPACQAIVKSSLIAAPLVDKRKPNIPNVKMIVLIELRSLTQPTEFLNAIAVNAVSQSHLN